MDSLSQTEQRSGETGPSRLRSVSSGRFGRDVVAITERGRLPRPRTPLIGRAAEAAAVHAMLVDDNVRLLTLLGPGGVGKTRLALHVAEHAAASEGDGVAFVPLATVSDPALVLPTIARALGVREATGRVLSDVLVAAMRNRKLLLVLDNFEHVLAAAADLAHLLNSCPDLTFLITSRAPLQLSGERRIITSPLALPGPGEGMALNALMECSALALAVDCARRVNSEFTLTAQNADAISEMCRRLDGLPLAIELAAAWLRVLTPEELLQRLEPRLSLLRGGEAHQPVRLRTMRDAIAWSYDALSEDEARLFRRLAVITGGFTLEAAERVGRLEPVRGHELAILDLLASLVDKSLLQHQTDGPDSRFTMLETVREFALERLVESGEAQAAEAVHAACIVSFAEEVEPDLLGAAEGRWLTRCDAELGNIRAALAWGLEHDLEMALRLAAALWPYWAWRQLAEGRRWLRVALEGPGPVPDVVRGKALTVQAGLALLEADVETATPAVHAALSLVNTASDQVAEAKARWLAACTGFFTGQLAEALPELDRSVSLFAAATTATDRAWAAYVRWMRGVATALLGDRETAMSHYETALAEARAVDSAAITLIILSDYAGWLGEQDEAEPERVRQMLQEGLALAVDHAGSWLVSGPLIGLALVDAVAGEFELAARRAGAAEALFVLNGVVPTGSYPARLERASALAAASLGDEAYNVAWAVGHADPHGIIAEAIGRSPGAVEPQSSATPPAAQESQRGTARPSSVAMELTARQREVLRLIVAGHTDKEIAAALGISRRTASNHGAALRAKLDAPSRSALAAIAVRDELL